MKSPMGSRLTDVPTWTLVIMSVMCVKYILFIKLNNLKSLLGLGFVICVHCKVHVKSSECLVF